VRQALLARVKSMPCEMILHSDWRRYYGHVGFDSDFSASPFGVRELGLVVCVCVCVVLGVLGVLGYM